jgi:hypothetical protein
MVKAPPEGNYPQKGDFIPKRIEQIILRQVETDLEMKRGGSRANIAKLPDLLKKPKWRTS